MEYRHACAGNHRQLNALPLPREHHTRSVRNKTLECSNRCRADLSQSRFPTRSLWRGCSQVTASGTRFAEIKLSTAPILRRRFHRASHRPHRSNRRRALLCLAVVRSATAPPPSRSQSLSWHATHTLREYDLSIGLPVTSAARDAPPHSSVEASLHHRLTLLRCGG